MIKYFLAFFIGVCYHAQSQDLVKYYNGKLKLSEEQILHLSDSLIHSKIDDYLTALAYYQKGVYTRKSNENIEAYEHYDQALFFLNKADTSDHFLKSAILRNQGVILKQYGLTPFAIEKYQAALEPAFKYSTKQGLSVKYNLGRAMMYENPEGALEIFMEELEIAKKEGLQDRMAKVYYEIGQIFLYSNEYAKSIEYFEKAVNTAESDEVKFRAIHNLSQPYDRMEQFSKQKEILLRALEIQKDGHLRFISLMDLGECLLELDKKDSAMTVLLEAENFYLSQPLEEKYIKVFKWLEEVSDSKGRYDYLKVQIEQQLKIRDTKENLLKYLNKQMEKESQIASFSLQKKLEVYQKLTLLGIMSTITILLTWRIWWYRLRKRLGKKILALVSKWAEEDREY